MLTSDLDHKLNGWDARIRLILDDGVINDLAL
jgi:hypothetical protein